MIEKRDGYCGGRRALAVLKREWQFDRRSGRRQQWSEIKAVTAKVMACLLLLIRGSLDRRRPVGIGMRNRTQLGDE